MVPSPSRSVGNFFGFDCALVQSWIRSETCLSQDLFEAYYFCRLSINESLRIFFSLWRDMWAKGTNALDYNHSPKIRSVSPIRLNIYLSLISFKSICP